MRLSKKSLEKEIESEFLKEFYRFACVIPLSKKSLEKEIESAHRCTRSCKVASGLLSKKSLEKEIERFVFKLHVFSLRICLFLKTFKEIS